MRQWAFVLGGEGCRVTALLVSPASPRPPFRLSLWALGPHLDLPGPLLRAAVSTAVAAGDEQQQQDNAYEEEDDREGHNLHRLSPGQPLQLEPQPLTYGVYLLHKVGGRHAALGSCCRVGSLSGPLRPAVSGAEGGATVSRGLQPWPVPPSAGSYSGIGA